MNDPAIPPMPELAAWILKHEIKKYPSFSETEVAKRARSRILNRRGGKGKFLTENAKYWIARMQGGGGVGKNSVLPIGHTTMDKSLSWREGFRVEGDPVIIEERDYPGLDLQEIADLFTAQAIVLYRTETRGSNIGPDISNLADPEPLTAINMEGETNFDLLLTQRKQREAYANTVLRSLHYAVPQTMGINFNSTRGRIHGLHPLMFNPGTENVGIALPIPQPNEVSNLVCIEILGTAITSPRVLLERGEILAEALEEELSAKTMLCSKGKTGYIYIAGGTMGGLSYNDVYDRLATMGKLVGNPASNSKVSYKDIEFKDLGIKVSRESFTRRNEDVLQLPLSLDIYPSKEKESMSKAYEGSHRLGAAFNQTGLAITPVANPMVFDPGYDDHPQIVQYRMNEMAPAVIEFLRQARVAIPESEVEPELVLPSNTWQQMRTENAKVKEAKQEDLERVNDAFCIPKGREVSLVFDGTRTVMQVNNELAFTGIPQTNDFNQYCVAAGIESISVKGILTPSDGTNHALLDRVVEMDVIPSDLGESLNTFMPLEVQVYGALDDTPLSRIRGLGYPRAKFVRNISTESEGSNFAELVTDELDSGYATRILLDFADEESKNMYSEQVLDAAVIGFDLEGKNPQNGMIGKVIVALLSSEKIRVDKGGKPTTIKAEMYNPIGVVGAFAGFDVDAKRRIFEHLSNNATHPGYDDGYLMVNPEKANLVVRIMHKGVLSVKRQPRFRLVTKMKDFVGPTIPVERSPLDSTLGRGVPTDMNLQRLQFGGRPEKIPGNANLEPFDEVELPIMRSPTITSIVTEVDGFEEHFIEKDDTYSSRYSEQSERLTFKAPLTQLPFNNPLGGPEPILDEAYEGPMDVQTLLTMSMNPPTENWSAHRQRVPWDFAPNAFGRGSAFRTFKMDDPTSRRKAIHMDGWNRRYDKYKGVQAIAGRLLNGKWHIQSIRVPRKYKLRRTLKEVRLDRKRPPKWYKELHPEAKPFGTKKNPPGGFNVVLSADPQEWSAELDLVTQGFDLLDSWFPSTVDFTERVRANIETDFRAGDFATLTEYLNSDYWQEMRDLIIIHDGNYHHSRGGLGFGQTASTSDKSYASTSFSLPFLRRVPSVLPIIHETGHLIGATQRDFEIDDGHHCTNDCIMTDDATMNYMEWEERLRNEGRWNKDMFCPTCITQIEAQKENPLGAKIIDLSNLSPSLEEGESLEVFTDGQPSKNKFSPMFVSPISAKKASPTDSVHLVIPGLMPAPQEGWKKYRRDQIFYMPNDVKPHFHGAATHHLGDGFALNRAFVMSSERFVPSEKQLIAFRNKIKGFSDGQAKTPVETWIHWKIPSDEKEYPTLRVQKDSIIWWDYSDMHNLSYVKSADRYKQNKSNSEDILIEDNVNEGMNIVATIMDKVGKFHFLCSVPGHAGLGHKIVIDVVERTKTNPVFTGIKEAHEHYDYPGSHRTGSVISDGVVVRSYSTGEIDTISADESEVKYKIKTKALNDAFKLNKSEQIPVRFFLKKSDGVHDMGLYSVTGVRKKIATLTKMMKSNPIIPHNYIKAMDEGWTGFPTWAIQPTFSISDLQGNPPKKTPGGKTIPKRYLKGLTKEEMEIAIKEIDKGYKYDVDDPEAYEYWKSDIKATARGYKTVPSKYKKKFIKMYGPLPEKGKFIDKIAKATKIKKRILQKVYDKGLAAWRVGHRPGVQQHQWAAGRVYSFVTLGNTVVKGKKKMSDYTLAVEAGLIKDGDLLKNPPREIPDFGYHFTHKNNLASIMETGLRSPVFLFYPDSDYHSWVITGQIDGVWPEDAPSPDSVTARIFDLVMLKVRFDREKFRPVPYEVGELHDEFMVEGTVPPENIEYMGDFNETVGKDMMEGIVTVADFEKFAQKAPAPNMKKVLDGTFTGDPDHLVNPLKIITSDIITISGRSGSGKSTIAKGIKKRLGRDARIVPSYMTRKKRTNEKEPEDGVFITKKKFKEMIKRGEFTSSNGTDLWVEQESGHFYGRRAADFERAGIAIVDVSFPGLKLMREAFGDKVYAVLIKSRMGDERNREILRRRGVHTEEEIERRVKIGSYMMKDENWKPLNFDFVASNRRGELDKNVAMISAEFRKAQMRDNPAKSVRGEELPMPKKLYHLTLKEHLPSIKKNGLVPQHGPLTRALKGRLYKFAKERNLIASDMKFEEYIQSFKPRIYLASKKEEALFWKTKMPNHEDFALLEISVPETLDLTLNGMEWTTPETIPAKNIREVKENPPKEPPTLEEFREWVDLVNMKNKELKAFMDSDWFAVSGLTPKQAKEQGIKSGQDSFRAIIRMRKKLGLRGPKDYIKSGPRITKQFYELALKKWTGPDASVAVDDDLTDWGWMKRQLRFNKRASAFPYNQAEEKRKGPLVKKQKTQNKPSRRLLSLWVWGHDPWRWARKHGVERMPKCPDVPWVGMTEKRKYGKVPVLMGPKKNPAYPSKKHGHFPETVLSTFSPVEEENHEKTQKHQKKHDAAVKNEMQKTFPGWTWNQMPLEGKEGAKEAKALRAARKKVDGEIGAFTVCPVDCKYCMIEQGTKRNPRVMSNPVIESGIPGVRMAYMKKPGVFGSEYNWDSEIIEASKHEKGLIGETPVTSTSRYQYNEEKGDNDWTKVVNVGKVVRMSPNDYFDLLTAGGYDIPERSAKVRWKDLGINHVMSIVDGLKNGQVMIMPTISFDGRSQEGGHRMEALRQMGHADTPVPVMYLHDEEQTVSDANPAEEIFPGPHGALTETEFFRENPPATMMTAFQTDGPRADNNQLYAGGGKVVQAKLKSGEFEKHPTYGTRYKKYPATDPDQKHFSPLPFIARKWKKSTFKSQPETDYTYFKEQLEQDDTPYTVTLKIDGEGTLAHFDGKETVIWNWYDRWRTNFHITDEITKKLKKKGVKSAKIMGELYAVDEKGMMLPMTGGSRDEEGRSETVGSIIKTTGDASTMDRQNRIRWAAFDLLELNGVDMRNEPFEERIDMLKELLSTKGTAIVIPHRRGKGLKPFKTAWEKWMRDPEFEGGVLRFDTGKTFKVKGAMTADMAVIGYYYGSSEEREGRGGSFADWAGGLALAFMDENGNYVYSGNVGTGFTHADRQELEESLSKQQVRVGPTITKWNGHLLATDKNFGKHDDTGKGIMYAVAPSMIVEVEYRGLNWGDKPVYKMNSKGEMQQVGVTQAPTLFQPSFKRFRFDKELTPFDLRMSQVAGEGEGKWKKNPVNTSYTLSGRKKIEIPRIVVWPRYHTVADARKYPNHIFLFGDNDRRTGKRGQAVIRGEPNAFGIRTKHKPATSESSYFSDERYEHNIRMMKDDFVKALEAVEWNGTLVLPKDGLGTGLADLPNKAPQTFAWLQQLSEMLNTFATNADTEAEVER